MVDWIKAQAQLEKLGHALTEAEKLKKKLIAYGQKLNRAWSADEVRYFNRAIEDLTTRCGQLAQNLKVLRQDMKQAMEDLREQDARTEAGTPMDG